MSSTNQFYHTGGTEKGRWQDHYEKLANDEGWCIRSAADKLTIQRLPTSYEFHTNEDAWLYVKACAAMGSWLHVIALQYHNTRAYPNVGPAKPKGKTLSGSDSQELLRSKSAGCAENAKRALNDTLSWLASTKPYVASESEKLAMDKTGADIRAMTYEDAMSLGDKLLNGRKFKVCFDKQGELICITGADVPPKIEKIPTDPDCKWYPSVAAMKLDITDEQAQAIIDAPRDDDGRSGWFLLRLASGNLVLACYPYGDTYADTERYRGSL